MFTEATQPENPRACPIAATIAMLGGKWKPMIVHMLADGTLRFGQIKRNLPAVSQKMLTQQLRELEADGIVRRVVYAQVPPRVEYSLTAHGATLKPILEALYVWGTQHAAITADSDDRAA
jgi:DNA-binding HxlR family transcriptional regulator